MLLLAVLLAAPAAAADRVALRLDTEEAEAVWHIIADRAVTGHHWQRLFATEGYRRLKQREAELHRDFTDEQFRAFVLSDELALRSRELASTLAKWKQADLNALARRVLAYLPESAVIRATVYPVIKPQTNSFVFDLKNNPAIFLYLDPKLDQARFENTVAHELHHIGFASVSSQGEKALEGLPPEARKAAEWLGAFGEGIAMLAAAGSPDVHPHAASLPADRARWDRGMANLDSDLKAVEKFLLDILDQRLTSEEDIRKAGYAFFGVQGPWYTVGWEMAAMVEKRFGRAALIDCMLDPRRLLAAYNRAAAGANRPLWSERLVTSLGASFKP